MSADAVGIARAADQVRAGGVIVYPTETVYGLGADPFNADAVNRIFAVKGRHTEKALILLIRGWDDLNALAAEVPQVARDLMEIFWPGPLTLIFRARAGLPDVLLGPDSTIALRLSDALPIQPLLDRLGGPITSTSANRSGGTPVRSASEAASTLGDHINLILDGGPTTDTRPSTLVDISRGKVDVLRKGRISSAAIHRLGEG